MWFYVTPGPSFSFLDGREQKRSRALISALLPIRKRDTVKYANRLFVGLIELLALVIAVPFHPLRAKPGYRGQSRGPQCQ